MPAHRRHKGHLITLDPAGSGVYFVTIKDEDDVEVDEFTDYGGFKAAVEEAKRKIDERSSWDPPDSNPIEDLDEFFEDYTRRYLEQT